MGKIEEYLKKSEELQKELLEGSGVSNIHVEIVKDGELDLGLSVIESPADAALAGLQILSAADRAMVVVCVLNGDYKPIALELVHMGTVDGTVLEAREIFKSAIILGASYIVLYHNKPLKKAEPDLEDIYRTKRLRVISELLNIPMVDHVIVGFDGDCVSMRDKGLLDIEEGFSCNGEETEGKDES